MARLRSGALGVIWTLLAGLAAGEASATESPRGPGRNTLQAVDYALLPAGGVLVKVTFRDTLANAPAVLVDHHPVHRITFDFPDAVSTVGKQPHDIARSGLRSFQVAQAGNRTRLILNLDRPFMHETVVKGNELLITLRRRPPSAARAAPDWSPQPVTDGPRHSLREVAFQPGAKGAGSIHVEVSHASMPIDVRRQGDMLILDFPQAELPRELARRLDVQDFGTPIRAINTYPVSGYARIAVELAGAGEIAVYQLDRRFVLAPL
jgi:type IV pilus assembly protein PilQ